MIPNPICDGIIVLPWNRATQDVTLERLIAEPADPDGRFGVCVASNVLPEFELCEGKGIGWGENSSATLNLAACIIDRFVGCGWGETAEWFGRPVPCSPFVLRHAADLAHQLLAPVPFWGGTLPGQQLRDWIGARWGAYQSIHIADKLGGMRR